MKKILLEVRKEADTEGAEEIRRLIERVAQVTAIPHLLGEQIVLSFSQTAELIVGKSDYIAVKFGHDSFGWWLRVCDNGSENPVFVSEASAQAGSSLLPSERIDYISEDGRNCLTLAWADIAKPTVPKILIVEDEPVLRTLYQAYLNNDYETEAVSSGLEAIEALHREPADLVLSDINMSGMDGLTLRAKLVEDPETELMPFVFLTGHEDDELVERATSLGIDDYLLKPVTKEHLLRTVERVLGRSRQIIQRLSERIDKGISSSLTPSLPEKVKGWRMSFATRNTGVGGGDFLFHQCHEDRTLLLLADIMGHDDTAKFFSFSYGGYIRGLMLSSEFKLHPAALLEQLSAAALNDQLMCQTTLTCTALALLPDGGMELASAGHPPPLIIGQEGVKSLPVGGMLPGVVVDPDYQVESIKLKEGERIALYTDGLFESASDEMGRNQLEDRLQRKIKDTLGDSLHDSLNQVMALFDEIAGNPAMDDTLLLLLEPD